MHSSEESVCCKKSPPAWHTAFLAMVPATEAHAKFALQYLCAGVCRRRRSRRSPATACVAFGKWLVELNKAELAYPSALARFAVAQTKDGRKVGGRLNVRDVSSPYCQRKKGVTVDRLDSFDSRNEAWLEVLLEDRHAGPAEVAAMRVDFSAWLKCLPRRLRKIATFLANGETTTAAAKRFRVSPGRISQIRMQLLRAWQHFQGDEPVMAVA